MLDDDEEEGQLRTTKTSKRSDQGEGSTG